MHTNIILTNKRRTHAQSNSTNTKLKAWFRRLLRHPVNGHILHPRTPMGHIQLIGWKAAMYHFCAPSDMIIGNIRWIDRLIFLICNLRIQIKNKHCWQELNSKHDSSYIQRTVTFFNKNESTAQKHATQENTQTFFHPLHVGYTFWYHAHMIAF